MFNRIKYLLPLAVKKAGIEKQMEASEICLLWERALEKIFPAAIKKTKALSFKDKTLKVAVLGSVWAQELEFKKQDIIEFINGKKEQAFLERIRFEQ